MALQTSARRNVRRLAHQLRQSLLSRAGDRLIGARGHRLYPRQPVERGGCHERDYRGAVRVCDYAVMRKRVRTVYLRYNEGHVVHKAERGAVIDKHRAALGYRRRKKPRDCVLRRTQHKVCADEAVPRRLAHGHRLAVEFYRASRAARTAQRHKLRRDPACLYQPDHLTPDHSRRAKHRNAVIFHTATS